MTKFRIKDSSRKELSTRQSISQKPSKKLLSKPKKAAAIRQPLSFTLYYTLALPDEAFT